MILSISSILRAGCKHCMHAITSLFDQFIILVGRYLMNRTINFIFRVVARREESFFVQDALVPNANQAKCFILSLRKGF